MKIVRLTQGDAAWHAHRAQHRNASDAPAVMGCSPYKTRAALLREVHTGLAGEVDASTQRLFDAGHRFEALARPLAEQIIGDDLYPCVGTEGQYSASFDGLTLDGAVAWEHKTLNDELRAALPADGVGGSEVGAALPLHYRVQMEHQCMVSGAERVLFTASRWADDGELIEARHCWYTPDAELRAAIIAGWQQFAADLAAYVPPPVAEPAKAAPMESLPAVSVRLDGALSVAGNLPTFAQALREFIAKIPVRPATDDEFATVDAACKALKKAEEALDAAEAGALASITDVEAMRRAVADCRSKLARDTRLASEKLVERRKLEMKEHAVLAARRALDDHIAALQAELAPMRLQPVPADFAGAIKGLRSIASMQDALDTTLAQAKIAADQQARLIRGNLAAFKDLALADDLGFLFADLHLLVAKQPDDFAAVVRSRIAQHREAEAAREAARQAAEAKRIAEAEQRAREAAEREAQERIAAAQKEATPAPAPALVSVGQQQYAHQPQRDLLPVHNPARAAAAANEAATLKLGTICDRLGFTVSAAFLADSLHIRPAKTDGRAALFTESQFQTICQQLQSHVNAMGELYAGPRAA